MQRNQLAALLVVGALVLLSGCASMTVHSTVDADGTISEYRMNISTSRTAYGLIEQSAEDEGYENVSNYLLSDVDEENVGSVSYEESFDGDEVTMSITMVDVEPEADSGISVTEEDGRLVYEDETFYNESYDPDDSESGMGESLTAGMSVDYYLTMPGEITDTNADSVDGDTAEWHETGPESFEDNRIYAESQVQTGLPAPGFGVVAAVVAMLGGALALSRRRS